MFVADLYLSAAVDFRGSFKNLQLRSLRPHAESFWRTHRAGNRSGDVSSSQADLRFPRAMVGDAESVGSRRKLGSRFCGRHDRALRTAAAGHLAARVDRAPQLFQSRSPAGVSDELAGTAHLHRWIAACGI